MSYTPKVGDRVRYTTAREGTVIEILSNGTVRVELDDGRVNRIALTPGTVTFEKVEPPLKSGDVLLFEGSTRVRRQDGSWVNAAGQQMGYDSTYKGYDGTGYVKWIIKGGEVVA